MENEENVQFPIKTGTNHILKFMQDFMKIPVQPTPDSDKNKNSFDFPF